MRSDKGPNLMDRHIGSRLAGRRRQLGLTAPALDQALSVSPGSTARFENGDRTLTVAQLLILTGVLKVCVDYFFEGAPGFSSGGNDDLPLPELIGETEHFLAEFKRIRDHRVRRDLLGLVQAESDRGSRP